jgi:DNA-binding MarR family transcriptional regulator
MNDTTKTKRELLDEKIKECANLLQMDVVHSFIQLSDIVDKYVSIRIHTVDLQLRRIDYTVLNTLVLNGGTMSPTEISREVLRPTHTVTRIVDNLEARKLVKRILEDKKDRRRREVSITINGIDIVMQEIALSRESVIEHLFPSLEVKQVEEMVATLNKFRTHLISLVAP